MLLCFETCTGRVSEDGGKKGKTPPRVLENPIPSRVWVRQSGVWKIPPRVLENYKSLHEPCYYTFLDKQVSEEKLKKWRRFVALNCTTAPSTFPKAWVGFSKSMGGIFQKPRWDFQKAWVGFSKTLGGVFFFPPSPELIEELNMRITLITKY